MFARYFVDRPVLATVISVVIIILGLVAVVRLPIAQYPEIAPPTISVTASYPGANAKVVAETVATPIEQEINGVENMLYMTSRSTNDGQMTLDVTFKLGTDLDMAQVLVQNRVSIAMAKLPEDVKKQGVQTKKKSPNILLCVNLVSEKEKDPATGEMRPVYDQLYLSNYATIQIKDALSRITGVGDVLFLGPRDYSMRVWLDPQKLASRGMIASDVTKAISTQNRQVAAGQIAQQPAPPGQNFQTPINTLGRLQSEKQFGDIVVRTDNKGGITYLRDVVADDSKNRKSIELGAKNYDVNSYLDGEPSITLAIFQQPGSNALSTAQAIKEKMRELKGAFPSKTVAGKNIPLIDYKIVYDTTVFIEESVHEVYKTLLEAFVLVFVVVLIFLQDWRATLLPMIDVPVSLIGTLAVMAMMGFSINNLSLFGLVLAIGIVVDDAIIVVENVERWMRKGLAPREATIKAMEEITGSVIAVTLVLSAVFIPTAFMAGISGQFFKQFALTIAASTIISAINAMTMAPARAVTLIKPHDPHHHEGREALPGMGISLLFGFLAYVFLVKKLLPLTGHEGEFAWNLMVRLGVFVVGATAGWVLRKRVNRVIVAFFDLFNKVFDWLTKGYGAVVAGMVRLSLIMMMVYAGLIGLTYVGFRAIPEGFIPEQDKGYLVVYAQLPSGASLERTDRVVARLSEMALQDPAVAHTIALPGYSVLSSNNQSNTGGMFVILKPFEERKHRADCGARATLARLQARYYDEVPESVVGVFNAPPVDGVGSTGGFKMQLQDRSASGLEHLEGAAQNLMDQGNANPGLKGLFTTFSNDQPQLYVDVDRVKAQKIGVDLNDIYDTLQAYLGSAYVNDLTLFGRNWQVNVQADSQFRLKPAQIGQLKVRNELNEMVPLATLVNVHEITGPAMVTHYNLYSAIDVNGDTAPGVSSGQGIRLMNSIAKSQLPKSMGFEWTELTFQQVEADKDLLTKLIFPLSVLFVFLVLAAQYENWSLPISILMIVPMCILAALTGLWVVGLDNNIFTQIGLVVLVGLAAKNAILIVEFAKKSEDEGMDRFQATVEACKVRFRPILMTSFAFILGVLPLALAKGAGSEMRVALGVAVFSGMVGVTFFGIIYTPVFYTCVRWFTANNKDKSPNNN